MDRIIAQTALYFTILVGENIIITRTFYQRWFVYILTQIQQFKRGDEVVVKSDEKFVKELQEGHGGWNEAMISVSF